MGPWSGAEHLDVESCGFLQYALYLHTIFSDDICIVTACLIKPVSVKIYFVVEDIAVQGFKMFRKRRHRTGFCPSRHMSS